MSAEADRVRVPTLNGTATGTVIDEEWAPTFNDQDCDMVSVDVEGHTVRARSEEIEQL